MSIDEKLSRHEALSREEERAVIDQIVLGGSVKSMDGVVKTLRSSSKHFKDESIVEMNKALGEFGRLQLIEASKRMDKMVATEFEAAKRTAQANRIENEAKRVQAELAKPLEPIDLKSVMPNTTKNQHYNPNVNFPLPGSGWC